MQFQHGLEGQMHAKLQHSRRTQTEHARSIPEPSGLPARASGGNTVDRTTTLGKPAGHHARRLVEVGEVGHIVEANTGLHCEPVVEAVNPAGLEIQGSSAWVSQLVWWGLRHYRSHGANLLQLRDGKQASGDQLLAGRGWLISVGRVVAVDCVVHSSHAKLAAERTVGGAGHGLIENPTSGEVGLVDLPRSKILTDNRRAGQRAIEVRDDPKTEATGYIEASAEGDLLGAVEQ